MPVVAESPSGIMRGDFRDRTDVVITFAGNSYYRATEAELERQIVAMCRLLVVAWSRGYWAAMSEIAGRTITGEAPPRTPATERYRHARDTMRISGQSADGRLAITYDGARDGWEAKILPGTLAALTQEQFVEAGRQASRDIVQDHHEMIIALKVNILGDETSNRQP